MTNKLGFFVVTGGASGLGEQTTKSLVQNNYNVLVLDVNESKGKALEQAVPGVLFCKCDICSEEQVLRALELAAKQWQIRCSGLINCAAILGNNFIVGRKTGNAMEVTKKIFQINVIGNFNVLRLVAQHIMKQDAAVATGDKNEQNRGGVIIQTASIAAFDGAISSSAYAGSKAAIVGMTLPIARELGKYGIRCVTIAPGIMRTPMSDVMTPELEKWVLKNTPFPHRVGNPDDFASLCMQIIENKFLNGEVIRMDGAFRYGYL